MSQRTIPGIQPIPTLPGWPQPSSWNDALSTHFETESWLKLCDFVTEQRQSHTVFPEANDVFAAFRFCPLQNVRFVILGQDPYHGLGQAHGLSFSVKDEIKQPPSLVNIFKELNSDLGIPRPSSGNLSGWARQGGLLLNTVLTVREAEANSHRRQGWEKFTDAAICAVNERCSNVAFVLWGKPAQQKAKLIDSTRHRIIESAHPSPLSAHRGFLGSKPFSQINQFLAENGQTEIDWSRLS